MTLIEILVVIAIITLVSAGIAVQAMKHFRDAKVTTAANSARSLREAAKGWWLSHDDTTCPSLDDLMKEGLLDEDSPKHDPWNKPWHIECAGNAVTVSSDGPDQERGTTDDIRIPPKRQGA